MRPVALNTPAAPLRPVVGLANPGGNQPHLRQTSARRAQRRLSGMGAARYIGRKQ